MTDSASALVAVLEATSAVTTLLTGGIYTMAELGQRGLSRTNPTCAAAWTVVDGLPTLRPCAVVRVRTATPTYDRHDTRTQETGVTESIEVWLYAPAGQWTTLGNASAAIYAAVQGQTFANIGVIRLSASLPTQAAVDFDDAAMRRDDYSARRVRKV